MGIDSHLRPGGLANHRGRIVVAIGASEHCQRLWVMQPSVSKGCFTSPRPLCGSELASRIAMQKIARLRTTTCRYGCRGSVGIVKPHAGGGRPVWARGQDGEINLQTLCLHGPLLM